MAREIVKFYMRTKHTYELIRKIYTRHTQFFNYTK
jgi:hypothetical protein